MTATAINLSRWQDSLKQLLPRELKEIFAGGSRRELLKNVSAAVLVFDDQVMDLATGRQSRLEDLTGNSAETLAQTVSDLLEMSSAETSVILLLPSQEFVATTVNLPDMDRASLVSALQLQSTSLLPCYSEPLAVAIHPNSIESPDPDVALWITERRLDDLYQAFARHGLFLAGILPRCLALADEVGEKEVQEEDRRFITRVSTRDGVIQKWLHVNKQDLEQEIFERQWRQAVAASSCENHLELTAENAPQAYLEVDVKKPGNPDYFFFPRGALQAKQAVKKGKRAMLAVMALGVVAVLGSLPFLAQEFEIRRLQASLRSQQELSSSAREDRQIVQNFEQQWGVITDFPEQQVVQTLFTLQSILSPEQLTSLELSQGVVSIEGESSEPQAILQRLEQHPRFTEVAFSRATNNSRYYIDLRLSTVNFEGYLVRYFPNN